MGIRGMGIAGAGLLLAILGCGGGRQVSDSPAAEVRPPYGGINLVLDTGGVKTTQQLFLDPGAGKYSISYPIQVNNDQECQAVKFWRYDFIPVPAPSDASQAVYATLLLRVDNSDAGFVSFWGSGGTWPVGDCQFNPSTAFVGSVPDTSENRKPSAVFLFLRQGTPCQIVDPQTLGRVAGYGALSGSTTVAVSVPGMDWPVGGASLTVQDSTISSSVVGIQTDLTAITQSSSSSSSSTSTSNAITTPITTVQAERVPTTNLVSPATSAYDLVFGWQPPTAGVVLTHGFYADPALVGGGYATGESSAAGGGFFLTQLPGVPSVADGRNTLDWTYLRSSTDSVWTLGWSADVSADKSIELGQSSDVFSTMAPGQARVSAQVRGFLSGLMEPGAGVDMFMGAQDWNFSSGPALLLQGDTLPLLARTPNAVMSGQMGQLVVGGRSFWYSQNSTVLGADVLNGDQSLVSKYGTVVSLAAYLPIEVTQ